MMISRKCLDRVGVMFEDFFLYYEELDWCERIKRAGFEVYIEPNARVYHKESASVGAFSTLKTYYINRNRIYFMRRNYHGVAFATFMLFVIFVMIPKNIFSFLLRGQFSHVAVFIKAVYWNLTDGFSKMYPIKNKSIQKVQLSPLKHYL